MATPAEIALLIQELPERKKSGSIRIWGQWFGRAMDNIHRCIASRATENQLILSFDQGETLTIWNPSEPEIEGATLSFSLAARIRWEWYYYGRSQEPENLLFIEYKKHDGKVIRSSNFNYPASEPVNPVQPAVQIYCSEV
jgi:hypothetical protein